MSNTYEYTDLKIKMDEIFDKYGKKAAIISLHDDNSRTENTFEEIRCGANKLKAMLEELGIGRAERIAVLSPHSPYATACVIQLAYIGVTAVLLDASLPVSELDRLIRFSDISGIIIVDALYNKLGHQTFNNINAIELCKTENEYRIIKKTEDKHLCVPLDDAIIAICFSSGTTSNMKGVMITYHSILMACKYLQRFTKLDDSRKFFNVLPSTHIAGYSVGLSCFLTGCEMGFVDKVDSIGLQQGFHKYQPTNFIMVPKVYETIRDSFLNKLSNKSSALQNYFNITCKMAKKLRLPNKIIRILLHPFLKAVFGKNIIICGCGTAPCSSDLVEFYQSLGLEFVNVYGCTECGMPITAVNRKERFADTGVGNIRQFSEINVKISDADDNGIGEVLVKTPLIMKGYFRETELTKNAFNNSYFKTGDNGYIDKKGYLHITGRIKDCIMLRSGKKLSPEDVDKYYFEKIPSVNLASCGITDDQGYDELHLFIDNESHLSDIKKAVESMPLLYRPFQIHVIEKIPMTSLGKVKRYKLKEAARDVFFEHIDSTQPITVIELISKHVPFKTVTPDKKLIDDLGLDSLNMLEIVAEINSTFDIDISDFLANIQTVGNIISIIDENCNSILCNTETSAQINHRINKSNKFFCRLMIFRQIIIKYFNPLVLHKENLCCNSTNGIIYAPNHRSTLDPLIITAIINRNIHWAALLRFFLGEDSIFNNSKNPFLCKITAVSFKKLEYFPIERKVDNPKANNSKAICDMNTFLSAKSSIGIFGEGTTRRPDGQEFGVFDDMFLQLAKNNNALVQPITIYWPKNKESINKVIINFGEVIKVTNIEQSMKLFVKTQKRMLCECKNACNEFEEVTKSGKA